MTVFKKEQISEAYPDNISSHYWTQARFKILADLVKPICKGKILDYGCGDGSFINYVQKKLHLDAIGYEPAPYKSVSKKIYKNKADVYADNVSRDIEVITLLDVIEHLDDPKDLLNELFLTFKNLKHVIITVPARMELWSNYDEHYGHKLRYEFENLEDFVKSFNRFNIRYIGYFFHLLYLPALLLTKTSKRNTNIIAPESKSAKLAHKLIAFLLYIEWKIMSRKIPGTSLVVVLSKM